MKNAVIYLIMMALFCSCNADRGESELQDINGQNTISLRFGVNIVIVDEELNDRLNPESPSYFGDDFTDGIEIFYLCDGKKLTLFGGAWSYLTKAVFPSSEEIASYKPITPPVRWMERYGYIDNGTLGFYFINCSSFAFFNEDDKDVTYTYIHYPDGSEDEIKVQLFIWNEGNKVNIDKLWINGELAYDADYKSVIIESLSTPDQDFILKVAYYNPKYYPAMIMEPYVIGGTYIGEKPKNGTDIVVITK